MPHFRTSEKELANAVKKFPLDSEIRYDGKPIGLVIGYKRANGTGDIEVIFQHYHDIASGKQGMFSLRARKYSVTLAKGN